MKFRNILLLTIALVVGFGVLTNPSEADFLNYLKAKLDKEAGRASTEVEDVKVERWIDRGVGWIQMEAIKQSLVRKSYLLFSTFVFTVEDTPRSYLGISSFFISLGD